MAVCGMKLLMLKIYLLNLISFFSLLALNEFCFANELYRPARPSDYDELISDGKLTRENAISLRGAEVAWRSREALDRDFPQLKTLSDFELDQWLLENFAYIGSMQQKLNGLRNSEIPVNKKQKEAYRPPSWLRSGILQAFDPIEPSKPIGMVDIKGFGHGALSYLDPYLQFFKNAEGKSFQLDVLRNQKKTDGLLSLGEAVAEVSRQQAAQMLFDLRPDLILESVESYAIIKLPFNILKSGGVAIPAALYLRQANIGRFNELRVPDSIYVDQAGHRQQTLFGTAVDFGGVILLTQMLASTLAESDRNLDPQRTKAWSWGHEVAWAFARYENPDKMVIYRHLEEVLGGLRRTWQESEVAQKKHAMRQKLSAELAMLREKDFNILNILMYEIFNPDFFSGLSSPQKRFYLRSVVNIIMRTAKNMKTYELIEYIEKLITIDHEDARKAMFGFRDRGDQESRAYIEHLSKNKNIEVQRNALYILNQMPPAKTEILCQEFFLR